MPYQIGNLQIDVVSGGLHRVDGGGMFGVVPRVLWQKYATPDAQHRILVATNCLLVRDGTHTTLIDTGYGGKAGDRERQIFDLEAGEPLVRSLAAIGVTPEQIDTVIFSHLHFDHVGGATRRDESGAIVPTFPNARYLANRVEWETAISGLPEHRAAYPQEHLTPLAEMPAERFVLTDDHEELAPGIRGAVTGGHTAGHQALVLESGGQTGIYLGDLCPMTPHVRQLWCMGFDNYPLDTRRAKPLILGRAADEGWLVFWDHDPQIPAGRLTRDPKVEFVVTPA